MLLSKETWELLGLNEPTYLEFSHKYASVYDVATLMTKKDDDPRTGFDPKAGKNVVTRKPVGTIVSIVQGEIKERPKVKVIDQAESKCHPNDQFSREKGRKYALIKLLAKVNSTLTTSVRAYSKAQRTAIWKDYFARG